VRREGALLVVWLALSAGHARADAAANALETTVAEAPPVDDVLSPGAREERFTPSPEEALESLPGVQLARAGGPLAPARVYVRGLAGPRVGARVLDLDVTDPLDGALDAAMLPLFFADELALVDAPGRFGALSLRAAPSLVDVVRVRALAGTLETVDLTGTAALKGDEAEARVGVRVARTQGDFAFTPTSTTGALGPKTTRDNNDQARVVAVARAGAALPAGFDATGAALVAHHEGGVPGFASAPTDGLRGETRLGALGLTLRHETPVVDGALVVELAPALRASTRSSKTARGPLGHIAAIERGGAVRASLVDVVDGLAIHTHARASLADLSTGHGRRTIAADAAARASVLGGLVSLDATVDGAHVSDAGPLVGGGLALGLGPPNLRASASLARRARAPTLDELYAPEGFITGNPDLRPETLTEGELALRFFHSRIVEVSGRVHAGRLDDTILFVHRDAYTIAPVNTGPAWRGGGDLALALRPHRFLGVDASAAALASVVDATGAPLPLAAPYAGRAALRLGALSGPHVTSIARARGPSSANLYGTILVAPYALVDIVCAWPVLAGVTLAAALTNVFDERRAQDANLLPLPGRQAFVSLEVTR